VPATSANLGAGFDVLGLALSLYNVFHVEQAESTTISTTGFGGDLPEDESNLFYRSFMRLYELCGQQAPHVRVRMDVNIPPGRGLGSSATAVVGGLMAANEALGRPYTKEQMLPEAVALEHGEHVDNVAPALLGGLVVNTAAQGNFVSVKVPFPASIRAVLFVPDFPMDTVQGRDLMPSTYPREDVVFSTGRVALFLAAITQGRYDLLRVAMEDRLHQPYRAKLFPGFAHLIDAALAQSAYGSCLSGGGSAVLALAGECAEEVASAMSVAAAREGIAGTSYILDIDQAGARASSEEQKE
jgi:homoserine kinase